MLPDREYLYREEIVHKLSVLNYLVRNREVQEQVALHRIHCPNGMSNDVPTDVLVVIPDGRNDLPGFLGLN